ncbi:toll/interleukin-1 receptor domain-containing protein [Pseudomonas sp. NPDC088444]|uniref:toll/interleukin-1 receptor domain-containing protein n=1 Tax=Pseudomonas sp. NPDC088444 TaxID=3364456 RepID=UPI00384ABACA
MTENNTSAESQLSIFISYAWGGSLNVKEWVRERVVNDLAWRYKVFWDRDSIPFGESIDGAIRMALEERPLLVLCLCDKQFIAAAEQPGSGLHRELQMLKDAAGAPSVRIVPLIFEAGCADQLPEPLVGRAYLDLQDLHSRRLGLTSALRGVAEGCSQAQVQSGIAHQVAVYTLRQRVLSHLCKQPITIWGNARTHEVTVQGGGQSRRLLLAPDWMWASDDWNFMLGDDEPTFCPSLGVWHWDHFTPSRGMRALGAAVLSTFFPMLGSHDHWLLNAGGALLAISFFSKVKVTEAFSFEANDLVTFLIGTQDGIEVLDKIMCVVDEQPMGASQ